MYTPEVFTALSVYSTFMKYIKEWRELDRQYSQIPDWRIFKQLKNIKQREQLTKSYVKQMRKWGILE